jgi:hypothetical protein
MRRRTAGIAALVVVAAAGVVACATTTGGPPAGVRTRTVVAPAVSARPSPSVPLWPPSRLPRAASGETARATTSARAVATPAATTTVFGTLGSQAADAAAENAAGITGATLEVSWRDYEPSPGAFSAYYVNNLRSRMAAFRAAGQQLTLAPGIHDTPDWVRALPDAIAVDEHGQQLPGIDMVFSQPVRDAVAGYVARIAKDLGLANFSYIRLTSGGSSEMLYTSSGSYAAFSNAAQNGPNMAAGMAKNPEPGWRSGEQALPLTDVQRWADWYIDALVNVTRWQIDQSERLGFRGVYESVTPGAGVRPDGYAAAVAHYLPDGLVGIGGVWQRYYAGLAGIPRLMAYTSSVADGSGHDDTCADADPGVAVTSGRADVWSATRWQRRLAVAYGFSSGGENPGYGDGIATDPYYADTSSRGMLATALRQSATCDFRVFNFAHDEQLWQGPASLTAYANAIRTYRQP